MSRRRTVAATLALLLTLSLPTPSLAAFPITILVRDGDMVPGVGLVTSIDNLAINNAGAWIVQADTNGDASSDSVLIKSGVLYLRENQLLTDPPGAAISSFDSVNLSNAEHSGWNFFLRNLPTTADSGIYLDSGLVIQESDVSTAPQFSPNTRYIGFFDAKINDAGRIAMVASIDDIAIPTTVDRALVIVDLDGSGQLLSENAFAKEGQILPGQTETVVDFGTDPHETAFNNLGQMLYFADLTGVLTNDGVIYLDLTKIAQEGSPSPVTGRNYEVLASRGLDLNNHGEVAFKANLDGDINTDEIIVADGEQLVHEFEVLPSITPFRITSMGTTTGPVVIDDDRNVLWFGDWDNPDTTKDTGLFLNNVLIAQEGDPVGGGLNIQSFSSGLDAFAMSRNGRYIVFETVLSNTNDAALMIEVQGPPPVPDGAHVPGIPMRAVKNVNGTDIDVTWDVTGCPGTDYNLFYGDLASVATLTYTGAACGLGAAGQATFTPPAGDVFFLMASAAATGVEGGHGYDSSGRARHASAGGQCGVVGQIRSARCP